MNYGYWTYFIIIIFKTNSLCPWVTTYIGTLDSFNKEEKLGVPNLGVPTLFSHTKRTE